MNRFIALLSLCLLLGTAHAQDSLGIASSPAGGAWKTKSSYTNLMSFGQPGVSSSLASEDGVWSGSIGFIGPVNNIGQNNAPLAIGSEVAIFLADSILELQGLDPDGDAITFEIVTPPSLGSLESISGGIVEYSPNPGLNPGQLYSDAVTFRVSDGQAFSENATVNFQFILEDVPHEIVNFGLIGTTMTLEWEDAVPNQSYEVEISYYDLSDPATAAFRPLVEASFTAEATSAGNGIYSISTEVLASSDPYIFDGDQVFITTSVTTPNGVGSSEAYVLDNTNGRSRTAGSEDGAFFAFGSNQVVRENGRVTLKLYAVELGEFSVSSSVIELLDKGDKGTVSATSVSDASSVVKEWAATYTSTQEVGGIDSVQFRVFNQDRQLFDTAWVQVNVIDVNDPPKLQMIADQVTPEDTSLDIDIFPSDPDNEFEVLVESNENTLVPATYSNGTITVAPQNDYSGRVSISVIVKELGTTEGYVAYDRFDLEVLDVDDAPVVNAIPDVSVDEDNAFTFVASATDVDATLAVFTYSVQVSDPSAFDVSINESIITLTPSPNINGTFDVSVFANDGLGSSTSVSAAETFQLTVNPINDVPEIVKSFSTQQIVADFPDYSINLGAYFTDVESGSNLTYTFSGNTEIGLSLSGSTMTVSPSNAFNSVEDVTITASDGESEVDQTISFVFVNTSANIVVANPIGAVTLDEDFVSSTIDISDVFTDTNDASALFDYTLSGGSFLQTSIDDQGIISVSSPEHYFGTETFYLFGSVGGQANFTTFDIEVVPVNDAPVIGAVSDKEVNEDEVLSNIFIPITDVDHTIGEITVTAQSSDEAIIDPSGITSSALSGGYAIALAPLQNANGPVEIQVVISDGEATDTTVFSVEVLPVNDVPEAVAQTIPAAIEDAAYTLDVNNLFQDVDGNVLTYVATVKPSWLAFNGTSFSGTPTNENVGEAEIKIRVDDSNGGNIVQTYVLTVTNVNDAPELLATLGDLELLEDVGSVELDLSESFNDPDGDVIEYTITSSEPTVMSVSLSGSQLTLTENGLGSTTISVAANDGNGGTVETSFLVTVTNVNDAPVVAASVSDQSFEEGFGSSVIDLSGTFTDEDGDQLVYSATSSDDNVVTVSIDNSGVTIEEVGVGTATIEITSSDGNGGSASFAFEVTVTAAPLGLELESELTIYPNPVSSRLYIKGEYDKLNWSLIDVSGRIILQDTEGLNRGNFIDVSRIPTGLYYLRLEGSKDLLKVIIRR